MHAMKTQKRDLTKDQFEYRARKLGCTKAGFMGYWELPESKTSVSVWNAGSRRRDQLNYLKREIRRHAPKPAVAQAHEENRRVLDGFLARLA